MPANKILTIERCFYELAMKLTFVLYSLITFCFFACSLKIYSDYDHDISFNNYKTFGWPDQEKLKIKTEPLSYNELMDKVIKREVDLQLNTKGYSFSESHPDLIMHYHIVLESWTGSNLGSFDYLYDSYWLNRTIDLDEYRKGTLIIDLADPKTDFLVWRGWAINFNGKKKPEQIENQVKKVAQIIFEKFPNLKKR
jgi:hypothetical protein